MRNQMFIIASLIIGLPYMSAAGTGRTTDGPVFMLVIVGFLLIVEGILYGIDFLKKNGKDMFDKTVCTFKKTNTLIKLFVQKILAKYFNLSYC